MKLTSIKKEKIRKVRVRIKSENFFNDHQEGEKEKINSMCISVWLPAKTRPHTIVPVVEDGHIVMSLNFNLFNEQRAAKLFN